MTYTEWKEMDDDEKSRFLGFEEGMEELKERIKQQIASANAVKGR